MHQGYGRCLAAATEPATKACAGVPLTEAGEPMCIRGEIVAALAVLVGEGGVRFMLCSGSHLWLPLTTAAGTENFEEVVGRCTGSC